MDKEVFKVGIGPKMKGRPVRKGHGEKNSRCPGLADYKSPKAVSGTRDKELKGPKSVVIHNRDGSWYN